MRRKSVPEKEPTTQIVKNIRRATRRHFSAEDKIRIVTDRARPPVYPARGSRLACYLCIFVNGNGASSLR